MIEAAVLSRAFFGFSLSSGFFALPNHHATVRLSTDEVVRRVSLSCQTTLGLVMNVDTTPHLLIGAPPSIHSSTTSHLYCAFKGRVVRRNSNVMEAGNQRNVGLFMLYPLLFALAEAKVRRS